MAILRTVGIVGILLEGFRTFPPPCRRETHKWPGLHQDAGLEGQTLLLNLLFIKILIRLCYLCLFFYLA